jgi:hypothetical protein
MDMAAVDNFVVEVTGSHDEKHISDFVVTPVVDGQRAVCHVVGGMFCQAPTACDAFATMPVDVNVLCQADVAVFVDVV